MGLPSWNLAFLRRLKVYTVPVSSMSQLSAMSGTSWRSVFMVTSPLNSSTTTPEEVVSVVRWGSSVGGSDHSLRNTPPDSPDSEPSSIPDTAGAVVGSG